MITREIAMEIVQAHSVWVGMMLRGDAVRLSDQQIVDRVTAHAGVAAHAELMRHCYAGHIVYFHYDERGIVWNKEDEGTYGPLSNVALTLAGTPDRKETREEYRARKIQQAKDGLTAAGAAFVIHNRDLHFIVQGRKGAIDFWPTTSRYRYQRANSASSFGLQGLLQLI